MRKLIQVFLLLLLAAPCWGAWTSIADRSGTSSKTASTTLTGGFVASGTIGRIFIVWTAWDNISTTDGQTSQLSASDDQANAYTKGCEFTNGQAGAGAGATVAVFWGVLNTTATSVSVTITSASATAKGMTVREFSIGAGNVVSVAGTCQTAANDVVDPTSQTISGLTNTEYLFVHGTAGEGPNTDAYTQSASYTLNDLAARGTSGNPVASNMHVNSEFRIFTGTGDSVDITSTTADRDYAQVYVALKEAAPPAGAPIQAIIVD